MLFIQMVIKTTVVLILVTVVAFTMLRKYLQDFANINGYLPDGAFRTFIGMSVVSLMIALRFVWTYRLS